MPSNRTVLYRGSSQYGSYEVIEETYNDRPSRVLYGDEATPQSGTALDEEPELLFNYNQRFLEIIMSCQPSKLLVIGGGGFMLPTAAFHRFPDLHIDVVEIDELLVQIARDYFDLPNGPRLQAHVADGAAYLQQTSEHYDMIIVDAFSGSTIPPHLLQHETLLQYKGHLTKEGVLAINCISSYKAGKPSLAHETIAALQEVFPEVAIFQADPEHLAGDNQNHIIVAGFSELDFDYLQSVALDIL